MKRKELIEKFADSQKLALYKSVLQESESLNLYESGLFQTSDFLEAYTRIIDEYFHNLFTKSTTAREMTVSGSKFALVALGGYGRGEQCVHSDVDILILFEKKLPPTPNTESLVKELIYPLWDAKLETGYAVRTIKECLSMAWNDFDILTTMLDARFICGGSHIYSMLMEKFRTKLSKKYIQTSLNCLIEQSRKRYTDYGDSTYLLEPNLKSGHGGLRDYHTILWYGRIMSDIRCRRDLERYGFLSHDEFKTLENSLMFIWNIRNMLHCISGRKCDQLHFEHQVELANLFSLKDNHGHKAVETFMGELHSKMDSIKQINLMLTEDIQLSKRARLFTAIKHATNYKGIIVRERRLEFDSVEMIPRHPDLLLKIFVESGRLKKPLSIEARRIVSEFSYLIDDTFRSKPSNVESFEEILSYSLWEFNVINVMLTTGLLVKFMPEFSLILNKIQYNQYHLFPVDKHSIRCVQVINSFRESNIKNSISKVDNFRENDISQNKVQDTKRAESNQSNLLYAGIYRELRNRKTLLMAALLHDIGKGDPSEEHSERGSEIARNIMVRSGYSQSDVDEVAFLVKHHLFLIKIATRRDISDEEISVFCASKIEKVPLLKKLYLLTVADSIATGPKAWNGWTEALLRDLFIKVMGVLKNRELATKKAVKNIHRKKEEVLELNRNGYQDSSLEQKDRKNCNPWDETLLLKELDSMSRRYLLYVSAPEIISHLNLYRQLENRDFLWQIASDDNSDIRTITICGKDKPGFYSKLAGVFFLNGLNIAGSQAYSFGSNTALDIFKVMPPKDKIFEHEKWEKAEREFQQALNDDSFLDRLTDKLPKSIVLQSCQMCIPNEVRIDNETSSFFTIIEVFAFDFPGLLFAITNVLYKLGLDVRVAMVATKIDQVVDVFYVKAVDNGKIDDTKRQDEIKHAILEALPLITGHNS
ncbi:MAG: HD domain-containing protein [Desulfamplus sp.]|nr:HD domain-containing protein [Desulfamplus sp.]MBF0412581.1 HD domain-containing protein [Desulfamplus sp.]